MSVAPWKAWRFVPWTFMSIAFCKSLAVRQAGDWQETILEISDKNVQGTEETTT